MGEAELDSVTKRRRKSDGAYRGSCFLLFNAGSVSVFTFMKTVSYQITTFFLHCATMQTHLNSSELSKVHAEKLLSVANVE